MKVSYFETARYVAPQPPPSEWPVPPGAYDPESGVKAYEAMVERLRFVEELGFDWISVSEHHYSPRILTGDDSQQPAAAIGNLAAERQAAERDPFAAGKAAALHGFNETRNPFSHPSVESADWLRGFTEGEAERGRSANIAAAMESSKRRRRRRGNGQEPAETPA